MAKKSVEKNVYPMKGGEPAKMFSGKAAAGPHTDLLKYAHDGTGECKDKPMDNSTTPTGLR